jgi:hypothetical protein
MPVAVCTRGYPVHGAMGYGQNSLTSVAVPLAPVWVPSQSIS